MQGTEAFTMVSTVGIIAATVYGLARAFFNRPSKRALPAPSADPMLHERLDRLEGAIQAIAIETERIAEGQRFTTRLLSQGRAAPGAPSPAGGAPALVAPAPERRGAQ